MSHPSIYYHYFRSPLPYVPTLALQNAIHALQLTRRRAVPNFSHDYLLLLQHRPVYTAGRRQVESDPLVASERTRLERLGADFVATQRGGQTTYHGPGQVVGYPLLDLARAGGGRDGEGVMSVREYVCTLERTLRTYLLTQHGIKHVPSEHTGVFIPSRADPAALAKLASIGVQVRHRLTTHGFALNVERAPLAWFERVIACGLADVRAACVADYRVRGAAGGVNAEEGETEEGGEKGLSVEGEVPALVKTFGEVFGKEMRPLEEAEDEEVGKAVKELEELAERMQRETPAPADPSDRTT